jgi:hypothetical protein
MKKGAGLCLLIILLGVFLQLNSEAREYAGETAAAFLRLGVGPRQLAMGGAFTGIADDIYGVGWNPGGLSQIEWKEATAFHAEWFEGLSYDYLGYCQAWKREVETEGGEEAKEVTLGVFGLSGMVFRSDEIDKVDENGTHHDTFNVLNWVGILSFGRKVRDDLACGVNLKLLQETCDGDATGIGWALDLGILHKTAIEGLHLGICMRNLGSSMGYSTKYPLPQVLNAGVSYRGFEDRLLLGLDVNVPFKGKLSVHFGGEYRLLNLLYLRCGYKTEPDIEFDVLSSYGAVSCGVGFEFKIFKFDLAYIPYSELGNTYQASISLRFGLPEEEEEEEFGLEEVGF